MRYIKQIPEAIKRIEDNKVKCCINCINFKMMPEAYSENTYEYERLRARCINKDSKYYGKSVMLKMFKEINKYKGRQQCPYYDGVDDDV